MKDIIFPITYKTDTKGLKDAESGLDKLGKFATNAGIAIAAGLAVASAAAVAFGIDSLKAAAEAEAITRGLENAAKNAGVFGDKASSIQQATKALDDHSKKLGELTGIDDELINQLKTGWLAVPDLAAKGTDGINKLAEAAADIAKGTGKDITAVAGAFTKIAGDSETALSKLKRIGIVLSDQQIQTYEDILATNGEIAAQDYLLQTLGDKYAGAAAAAANPFERLDVIFGNLKETIGGALLPAFEEVIPFIQTFIEDLVASPEFNTFLSDMSTNFQNMLPQLETAVGNFGNFAFNILPDINELLPIFNDALSILNTLLGGTASEGKNAWGWMSDLRYVMDNLATATETVSKWVDDLNLNMEQSSKFTYNWSTFIDAAAAALSPLTTGLENIANLIRWITGTKIYVPGMSTNVDIARGRLTGQATGGETTRAGLSWVGERGPELLNLPTGAQVIPLSKIGGGSGGGTTFNISVNAGMGTDGAALGEQIVTAIRKYERTSGRVFAAA